MNPEEGELRPQLLDRLPLAVMLGTIQDEDERFEIIRRNLVFAQAPAELHQQFAAADEQIRTRTLAAQQQLPYVGIDEYQLRTIASACIDLKVDGHRPEIIITRTALALAAYRQRSTPEDEDILDASRFTLSHRTREGGFEPPATEEEIETSVEKALEKHRRRSDRGERITFAEGTSSKLRERSSSPES